MNDELIKREALVRRINEWTDEILPDDLLELLQDCRAALTKKYVPMTEDELGAIWENDKNPSIVGALANIEAEVIRRAGLDVVCKQTENQK